MDFCIFGGGSTEIGYLSALITDRLVFSRVRLLHKDLMSSNYLNGLNRRFLPFTAFKWSFDLKLK